VSDPPLKQVVASTYEVGLRSNFALDGGKLDWKAALFRTNSSDDIINVASTVQGRAFFRMFPAPAARGWKRASNTSLTNGSSTPATA